MGAMGVNREQLADKCARIEKAGGSVLEYLRNCGCISPWGTWFRLQREELGRDRYLITDGKGGKDMQKITLEQKKKAVEMALAGECPLPWLKECGSKNPSAAWYVIRQNLKKADPQLYMRLEKEVNAEEPAATCCAPSTRDGVEVPDEIPEEPEKEETKVAEITKPVNYGGFAVTAVRDENLGGFSWEEKPGVMYWRTNDGDEICLTPGEWRKLADNVPRIMEIFGI